MLFGIGYLLYSVFAALIARTTIQGWTSLVCLQIIFSGAILMAVGVLGNYVARIYEESKLRPLYVVADSRNFPVRTETPDRSVVLQAAIASEQSGGAGWAPPDLEVAVLKPHDIWRVRLRAIMQLVLLCPSHKN